MNVSRTGYYAARQRAAQPPVIEPIEVQLKAAFAASGRSYGSRRWMREHRLQPTWKRKSIHTTDTRHTLPVAPNVLQRQFTPASANESCIADTTYIRTRSGWLYLAAMLDLYSRKPIGWAVAPSMPAELVCAALERVWQRDYANHAEAAADIGDYIVGFYNSTRLHSTLGYLPPNAFERKMAAIRPIELSEIS